MARQWEEEGYVDPDSFAELPTDEQEIAQVNMCAHMTDVVLCWDGA